MKPATKAQLRRRWTSSTWAERTAAIEEWWRRTFAYGIAQARPEPDFDELAALLEGLPYRHEVPSGWDLRGSELTAPQDVTLDGWDLSYSRGGQGRLSTWGTTMRDCRMDESGQWDSLWGAFIRCSFRGANLQRCRLSGGPFTDCVFDQAKLVGAKANGVDFRGSSFRGAKLRRIELGDCDLRGCDFTDADLTDATLIGSLVDETTRFRGAKLVDVRLVQEFGPPERRGQVEIHRAQMDERTELREAEDPSLTFWHAWLSAIMHHLPRWKDRPWAAALGALVEHKRQHLKEHPPDPEAGWLDDLSALLATFPPEQRAEVEEAIAEAGRDVS